MLRQAHWLDLCAPRRSLPYAEAEDALLGAFRHLHTDIYGNRVDYTPGRLGSLYLEGYLRQKYLLSARNNGCATDKVPYMSRIAFM